MNWGPSGDIGSSYGEDYEYDVDFEDEESSSSYGLRGSTFDEQSNAKSTYCKAEKSAAMWKQKMEEGTKEERAKARERFAEAKAASAKAWARHSEEGKSAWDTVKNKSTTIGKSIVKKTETWGEKAARWWNRNNPFEDEDEEMLGGVNCPQFGWSGLSLCGKFVENNSNGNGEIIILIFIMIRK